MATTTRTLTIDFKGRPAKQRVEPREGTMRATMYATLRKAGKRGVSFAKLHATCGFKNEQSTLDALRLLARKNGYAARGDEKKIVLV